MTLKDITLKDIMKTLRMIALSAIFKFQKLQNVSYGEHFVKQTHLISQPRYKLYIKLFMNNFRCERSHTSIIYMTEQIVSKRMLLVFERTLNNGEIIAST